MRRLAAALAEAQHTPDSATFEGFPSASSPTTSPSRGMPAPFLHLPPQLPAPQDAVAHLQAADDEEADGLTYARLAPRPMGGSQSQVGDRRIRGAQGRRIRLWETPPRSPKRADQAQNRTPARRRPRSPPHHPPAHPSLPTPSRLLPWARRASGTPPSTSTLVSSPHP
ncbi:hypothetical protein C8R45DRAFT_119704 [Mycena sanguinolenta]|nr:hypothetical protein C8R45DRAFT_119704 [Mycena sanguinolenta]